MQFGLAMITEEVQNGFPSLRNGENPNYTPVVRVENPNCTSKLSVDRPFCISVFELILVEVMKMIVQIGFSSSN